MRYKLYDNPMTGGRLVCAWCSDLLRNGPEPTSHGMCASCRAKWEAEYGNLPPSAGDALPDATGTP